MSSMAPGRALEGGGSTRWGPDCIVVREVPTTPARCLGLQFQHSPDPFQRRSRGEIPSQGGRKPLPPSATAPGDAHGRPTQVGIHITLSDPPAYRLHNTKIKHTVLGPGFLGETTYGFNEWGQLGGIPKSAASHPLPHSLATSKAEPRKPSICVCVGGAKLQRSLHNRYPGRKIQIPATWTGRREAQSWMGGVVQKGVE